MRWWNNSLCRGTARTRVGLVGHRAAPSGDDWQAKSLRRGTARTSGGLVGRRAEPTNAGWRAAVLTVLVAAGTVAAGAAAPFEAGAQNRRPHRWWQSEEVTALLALSEEQSASLDRIYQVTLPKMHESYRRLNAEERLLSEMVANMQLEEIDITRQVDRVEAARSELSKTRTLMVFRMYRILDPAQRAALKDWMDLKPDEPRSRHPRRR